MRFPTRPLLAGSVHPQRPLTILKWLSRYYPGRCANLFPVGLPIAPNTPTPSYPGFAKCRFWLEPANQPYAPNLSPACWVPDAAQPYGAVARMERSKSGTPLSILAGDQRSFFVGRGVPDCASLHPGVRCATLSRFNCFPKVVREAGFDPAVSCFQGRRITKLSHSLFGGAHGRTRTRIFNSDYGSPVRSRRRLRARWQRRRATIPRHDLERIVSCPVRRRPQDCSLTRTRTWIDRLTAGRPGNWWTAG